MTTVAFPNLVDAIITALKAASSLSSVRIFDGPEIDESYPGNWIAVGHDGTDDGDVTAGTSRNEYLELGNKRMFEDGVVNCTLAAWNGDTILSTLRTSAYNLLSAVDTVIRIDPSFGGVVLYSGLQDHSVIYRQTNAGAAVLINFTIVYKART